MASPSPNITSVLKETRSFPPSADFSAQANIKSLAEYERLWQRKPPMIPPASGPSRPSH